MFPYEIKESVRARSLRITVHPDGRVVVTKPLRMSEVQVERFVEKHTDWIERRRTSFLKRGAPIALPVPHKNSKAYTEVRERARTLARTRLEFFNQFYDFSYTTISIRDQKTRWGSCSRRGNLSFNLRIALLPPELADYVIVHELCHTKEHNHSEKFWAQVERTLPHANVLRKKLHTYSL
jgi:predicted metal-dependent hydrolase